MLKTLGFVCEHTCKHTYIFDDHKVSVIECPRFKWKKKIKTIHYSYTLKEAYPIIQLWDEWVLIIKSIWLLDKNIKNKVPSLSVYFFSELWVTGTWIVSQGLLLFQRFIFSLDSCLYTVSLYSDTSVSVWYCSKCARNDYYYYFKPYHAPSKLTEGPDVSGGNWGWNIYAHRDTQKNKKIW